MFEYLAGQEIMADDYDLKVLTIISTGIIFYNNMLDGFKITLNEAH